MKPREIQLRLAAERVIKVFGPMVGEHAEAYASLSDVWLDEARGALMQLARALEAK